MKNEANTYKCPVHELGFLFTDNIYYPLLHATLQLYKVSCTLR